MALEFTRDGRDDERHHGQHAEDEKGELDANVEQHGKEKQQADEGGKEGVDSTEYSFLILYHITTETCHHVTLAMTVVVTHGQMHRLAEHLVAKVADYTAADDGNFDKGEVVEEILTAIEHKKNGRKKQQCIELAEGDKPSIKGIEPLRNEVSRSGGDSVAGVEKNLQEVGDRKSCCHGEEYTQHHQKDIQRTSHAVRSHLTQGEVVTQFHRL